MIYELFLVSGFREKDVRIGKNLHKNTHYSIKNRGSTLILTHMVEVHP